MRPGLSKEALVRAARGVVILASLGSYLFVSTVALAQDPMSTNGAAGQSFGNSILPNGLPGKADGAGNLTLNPHTNSMSLSVGEIYPGAGSDSLSNYTNVFGSPSAAINLGNIFGKAWQGTNGSTASGQAYQTASSSKNRSRPDLSVDPIWNQTDSVTGDIDSLAASFADCSSSTSFTTGSATAHVPDYHQCLRLAGSSGSSSFTNSYTASLVSVTSGPGYVTTCVDGTPHCVDIAIGTVGDNYWSGGTCTEFDHVVTLSWSHRNAVVSATLREVEFDDYSQIQMNGSTVWQSDATMPKTGTRASCERGKNFFDYPNQDVKASLTSADSVTVKDRVFVGGNGEGYLTIRVIYDPAKVITDTGWSGTPSAGDEFCHVSATCNLMPSLDANGCVLTNNLEICAGDLAGLANTSVSPLCLKATVSSDCSSYYTGSLPCYVDAQGETQCPKSDGSNLNDCATYQTDPHCGFINSVCADGGASSGGTCYVDVDTYDCGFDAAIPTTIKSVSLNCSGPVRCMGNDCITTTTETNSDVAKATAALQVMQFITQDNNCTGTDPTSCKIFPGTAGTCKKAVAGIVDCCNSPTGVSLGDYITLLMAMNKVDAAMGAPVGGAIEGAWSELKQPIVDAWNEVSQPFSSPADSLLGSSDPISDVSGAVSGFEDELMKSTAQWVDNVFGDSAANTLFQAGDTGLGAFSGGETTALANRVGVQLAGELASAISIVMWAYTIYSVTMILIHLIWSCEQAEYELDSKRDLKSCHYIGTYCDSDILGVCIESKSAYCCFSSPLSRIIQEQVRPQLGLGWGSPKSPQCDGLTVAQLGSVDWSKVDLSEWIAILASTGNLPNASSLNLANITGNGSVLSAGSGGSRQDTATRTVNQLNGVDTTMARDAAATELRGTVGPPSP